MGRRKGIFGEELPATLLTVILLFLFMVASISMYTSFFQRVGLTERERAASSITEFVFYSGVQDPGAVMSMLDNRTGFKVTLKDLETGEERTIGSLGNASSASVSSLPLLVYSAADGRVHLARVDVHVWG